jgi:hypothetical protein
MLPWREVLPMERDTRIQLRTHDTLSAIVIKRARVRCWMLEVNR